MEIYLNGKDSVSVKVMTLGWQFHIIGNIPISKDLFRINISKIYRKRSVDVLPIYIRKNFLMMSSLNGDKNYSGWQTICRHPSREGWRGIGPVRRRRRGDSRRFQFYFFFLLSLKIFLEVSYFLIGSRWILDSFTSCIDWYTSSGSN